MSTEDVPKEIKASTEDTPKKDTPKKKEITMAGKGDKPRPYSTSQEEYARKWDKAFGKKEKVEDEADKVLKRAAEMASESVYIPISIEEISERIKEKNPCRDIKIDSVNLLNDNTLEAEIAKMKDSE